jgi:uncharacterized membrane protein YgdD (TMEM256/DUF423 family)
MYHFIHSWGLLFVALSPRVPKLAGNLVLHTHPLNRSLFFNSDCGLGYSFVGGIILFSGSLYALTLTNKRWLGAIPPFGGLLFLVGWGLLALTGI